jgi:hypothetical protein
MNLAVGWLFFAVIEISTGLNDNQPDDAALSLAIEEALLEAEPEVRIGAGTLILTAPPIALNVSGSVQDRKGLRLAGAGRDETVIRGVSNTTTDVLRLSAVSNVLVESLTIEAVRTGSSSAGYNGISLANGARNVAIRDVHFRQLPYETTSSSFASGRAVVVQLGTRPAQQTYNITIDDCCISDCAVAFQLLGAANRRGLPQSISFTRNVVERCCLPVAVSFPAKSSGSADVPGFQLRVEDNTFTDCTRQAVLERAARVSYQNNMAVTAKIPALPDPYQSRWPDLGLVLAGGTKCDVSYNVVTTLPASSALMAVGDSALPTSQCQIVGNYLYGAAEFGLCKLAGDVANLDVEDNRIRGCAVEIDPELSDEIN